MDEDYGFADALMDINMIETAQLAGDELAEAATRLRVFVASVAEFVEHVENAGIPEDDL